MSDNTMGIHHVIMKVALGLFVASFILIAIGNYNIALKDRARDDYEGSDQAEFERLQTEYEDSIKLREDITFYTSVVYLICLTLFMISSISVATNEEIDGNVRLGFLLISAAGVIFLGVSNNVVFFF